MPLLRAFAATLALGAIGALAGCQPAGDADYSDRYRPRQLDRVAAANLLDATPAEVDQARARDQAIYEAELARQTMLAGSLSAQQSARRGAQLLRQEQTVGRAQRDLIRTERDLARAERDLRTAERLDRSPVFTGPSDRADIRRRQDAFEASRALDRQQRAARVARRAADRLGRQADVDADLGRIDRLNRIDQRQADRARAAEAGPADALVPFLPYRHSGESVESLRDRVEAAEARSAETGQPVETILRAEDE